MKKTVAMISAGLLMCSVNVFAGEIDGSAVLGSAIGAAAGTAVGSAVGGKDGAIIGGGVGGAVGAAVGSKDQSSRSSTQVRTGGTAVSTRVIVDDDDYNGHRDNGLHKGQYKHKHKHGRD